MAHWGRETVANSNEKKANKSDGWEDCLCAVVTAICGVRSELDTLYKKGLIIKLGQGAVRVAAGLYGLCSHLH